MSITKQRLDAIRQIRYHDKFVPNFLGGKDVFEKIHLGLTDATQEEKDNAKFYLDQIHSEYERVYAKEQKRLAKKAARKLRVVRTGRP